MKLRTATLTALLLTACGDDVLEDRRGEPGVEPGAFPIGKWRGDLASDHADGTRPIFAGVRKTADAYEVVLEIGSGYARSFPARQDGAALVVEEVALHDRGTDPCRSDWLNFETITLRMEGGRLRGAGAIAWMAYENDTVLGVRRGAASFEARPLSAPPVPWDDVASVFHSPAGRFGTFVDEAVLLPDEVTIDLGSEEISGLVERGGSWDRNLRVVPTRPLPWGSTATVRAEVLDAAGGAHTLSFDLPTVVAPVVEPDPLLSALDGYASAGIRALSPADADLLVGRERAHAGAYDDAWVLAFEAEVPNGGAPRLEVDLVLASSHVGWFTRPSPLVTISPASAQPVEVPLVLTAENDRVLQEGDPFARIEDVTYQVDLSGYARQRVFISLSSAGTSGICAPWEGSTVLKRVEVVR